MILEFSFDDGSKYDLRVAEMLQTRGFRGTFYIPSLSNNSTKRGLMNDEIRELSKLHEIGGHTVSHPPDLKRLTDEELAVEIGTNKTKLQRIIEKDIEKFCYPRGRFDERVVEVVKSFLYKSARTTKVLDTDMPSDPFRIDTSVHIFARKEYQGKRWSELAIEKFNEALAKGTKGRFHLWGHSWEIQRDHEWDALELFLDKLQIAWRDQKVIA